MSGPELIPPTNRINIGTGPFGTTAILDARMDGSEPTAVNPYFFFETESYANNNSTFHLPFVVQLNGNGTGQDKP